jgi:DNA-binding NtrC family response regulator
VVIFGESGTGKELMARAIHENSARRDQAFVALNCGAVPDSLLEAELFGHRKGAFTGAERARQGLFRVADGGTLFLDEIADTSLAMQSKLLRALQDGEIRPLGSETTVTVDIRVLCASNKRLEDLVESGEFREDLYYRLNVLSVQVPALRDRRGDIASIANHILGKIGSGVSLSPSALRALQAYGWPGNVRELENELTRSCALADMETIEVMHLSAALQDISGDSVPWLDAAGADALLLKPQVEALERGLVEEAMKQTGGNQSKAALLLGMSRYGLQKKLQRYGIATSRFAKG